MTDTKINIEVLNVKVTVFILLLFASLPDWWFNITVTKLRKLKSQFLSKPFTVQLGTRVLTNFEINLAPSLLNFVRQAVPVTLVFLNYYRPGLLFAYFGDAKTLVRVNP